MAENCLAAYVTMPDENSANAFCKTLVRGRYAACANILGRASSFYWWEGDVQSEPEYVCLFKTTEARFPAFLEKAKELHPYEVPCIVCWPLTDGNDAYFDWVRAETEPEQGDK